MRGFPGVALKAAQVESKLCDVVCPFLLLQPLPPPSILFHPLHLHLFHLFSSLPPSDVHLYFTTTTRFDQADQTNKQIICYRRRENENFTWFPRRDLGSDAGRRVPAVGGYVGGYEANLRLEAKEVLTQPHNNTFMLLLRAMCGYACGWHRWRAVAVAEVVAAKWRR